MKKLISFAVLGLAASAVLGFAQPARAFSNAADPSVAVLRDYVQMIDAGSTAAKPDADVAALRGYVQMAANKPVKAAAPITKAPIAAEAVYVGTAACLGCHAVQAAMFNQTVMGKIFRNARNAQERLGCEGCHGPGSLHVQAGGGRGVGGMITFRLDDDRHSTEENNAICMSCHEKGERNYWRGSPHETRGLACANCHTVMQNVTPKFQLAKLTEMDTCFQCHKDIRAKIQRFGHMPLREGKMTCSNCHNPHGTASESNLKTATINDTCYKCHMEKRGPFLFEHAPVRENCTNCHDPHGSVNEFQLKLSRPRLCQQCHANLTGHPGNPRNPQSIYAVNRECQNCHQQVHGSNNPAGPRYLR